MSDLALFDENLVVEHGKNSHSLIVPTFHCKEHMTLIYH